MEWTHIGETIPDDLVSDKWYGFIYQIHYTDGTKYIGMKSFWNTIRLKPRKTDRVNAKRVKTVESNWRIYNGSSKLSKDKEIAYKEILRLCESKYDLSYWETYYLMLNNVLFDDKYLNQNCMGRYFAGKLEGSKKYVKC